MNHLCLTNNPIPQQGAYKKGASVAKTPEGNSTDAANKVYTHEDVEAIREDLEALPDIDWANAVM